MYGKSAEHAKYICQTQSKMESERSNWDWHWNEVAGRVWPSEEQFNQKRSPGVKVMDKVFDSTAPLALPKFASAIDSIVTPSTQIWHGLEAEDEEANSDLETKRFLEAVTKMLFRMRYRPFANFTGQISECYMNLGAFGTMAMFVEDVLGLGIRYAAMPMRQMYIRQSAHGIVDYTHRKFSLDVRQAIQKFGEQNLPEKIVKWKEKDPFHEFEFIHCVKPYSEYKQGAYGPRGMQYYSAYVVPECCEIVVEGGFRTFPYAFGRYLTSAGETYGRSPAMMALPDIKMVNEMEKTLLRAGHKTVDPPLLAYGDGILSAFNVTPNAINYGGVNDQGQQLVHPLQTGGKLDIGIEMTDQKRKTINDAFLITLFQILVQNPQMTATEALLRAQEKGSLLAPTMGRQQSEFLGAIITRELDISSQANLIQNAPRSLMMTGNRVKAVYTSPLSRLRRAEDGVAITRTMDMVRPLAEIKPELLDNFADDELVREIAEINGTPARVLNTRDEVAKIRAKREQDAQNQMMAEQAQRGAAALKSTAQAAQAVSSIDNAQAEIA